MNWNPAAMTHCVRQGALTADLGAYSPNSMDCSWQWQPLSSCGSFCAYTCLSSLAASVTIGPGSRLQDIYCCVLILEVVSNANLTLIIRGRVDPLSEGIAYQFG